MNPLKAANPITVTKRVFGLAGAAVGLTGTVAREAVRAPVGVTRGAFHLAGAAAGLGGTVARETAHVLRTGQGDEHVAHTRGASSAGLTDDPNIAGPTTAAAAAAAAAAAVTDVTGTPPGPTVVPVEPHAPEQPPVDVVGDALAAEAAADRGEGPEGVDLAHEPRAASRDEEHGDAALQRAEVEEIAEEASAAQEGDVEPEEHLTEPLLDSADAKAVAAELATRSKAADPDKD
ncbi:MAG TPA: hypothetical protein VFR88_06205 [Microlunatus sp.]|nr:hypothetical protein [Microlunatus sp.]